MKPIKGIVAADENFIIGHDSDMPGWQLTDDYKLNFVPKTKGCPVVMGRKTAESLKKLLPGRTNIVISRNEEVTAKLRMLGFIVVDSLYLALDVAEKSPGDTVWIIGGAQIYTLALPLISEIHITRVIGSFPAPEGKEAIYFPKNLYGNKFNSLPSEGPIYFEERPAEGKDNGNSHQFLVEVYKRT